MSESTPIARTVIDDALAIIENDAYLRTVAGFYLVDAATQAGRDTTHLLDRNVQAAMYIVQEHSTFLSRARDIAAQDPHPDAYTLAEMDALDAAATRVQAAVQALRYARKVREEASLRSFDDAEAQVQSAARELGRALGGET